MFVEIELRMANQSDIRNTVGPNFTAEASTNGSVEGQLVAEPQALWIIRIFLYVITFFIGVVGNVLVLLVVYKTPSLHSGKIYILYKKGSIVETDSPYRGLVKSIIKCL